MRSKSRFAVALLVGMLSAGTALAKSPARAQFDPLGIGPGNFHIYPWQINDAGPSATHPNAPGMAGPQPDLNNNVSGWSLLSSVHAFTSPPSGPGDMFWTATNAPGQQLQLALATLLGPTTQVGQDPFGRMADFDPTQQYAWPIIAWVHDYSGPIDDATLNAATLIDSSSFVNSYNGTFALHFDGTNKAIDLIYTPVPEPGTLGLVAVGLLGMWYRSRRRCHCTAGG